MPFLDKLDVTSATPFGIALPLADFADASRTRSACRFSWLRRNKTAVLSTLLNSEGCAEGATTGTTTRSLPVVRDDAGKTYLSLRSGARLLEIAPGKKAIKIEQTAELPEKLRILCEAVIADELDACPKEVGRPVPRAPNKNKAQVAPKPTPAIRKVSTKAR